MFARLLTFRDFPVKMIFKMTLLRDYWLCFRLNTSWCRFQEYMRSCHALLLLYIHCTRFHRLHCTMPRTRKRHYCKASCYFRNFWLLHYYWVDLDARFILYGDERHFAFCFYWYFMGRLFLYFYLFIFGIYIIMILWHFSHCRCFLIIFVALPWCHVSRHITFLSLSCRAYTHAASLSIVSPHTSCSLPSRKHGHELLLPFRTFLALHSRSGGLHAIPRSLTIFSILIRRLQASPSYRASPGVSKWLSSLRE